MKKNKMVFLAMLLCVAMPISLFTPVLADENSESYIQEQVIIRKDDVIGTIWWKATIESSFGATGTWYFTSTPTVNSSKANQFTNLGCRLDWFLSLSPLFNNNWSYQSYWVYYPGDGSTRTVVGTVNTQGLTISAG